MSHIDRDAVNLMATQLRNLTESIDRGEVVPSIMSVVILDDDNGRPTGEYNVSVTLRPKAAPPFMCGIVSRAGPNGEPLACAYPPGHEGDHSWATLPTFVSSNLGHSESAGHILPPPPAASES